MTTETMKEGEFDPGCVTNIYDKLSLNNYALRAFGALLQSSNLFDFADEALWSQLSPKKDAEAENLRWGLSQIINLYLAHQEQILAGYCDQYHNSDIGILYRVERNFSMVEQGAFSTREATADCLRMTITNLDLVINRGGELKEKATALKETCLKYLKQVPGK